MQYKERGLQNYVSLALPLSKSPHSSGPWFLYTIKWR